MAKRKSATSLALLLLGAMAFGALTGSGCAVSRGDLNTVQPLALDKKQFEGDWYYLKTIIDAPFDAPGLFIGSTGDGWKIRWEITERFLYAYAVQANVRNTDSSTAPVMAWPITGHFTVRYRVNYSTGEPSNVIGEDRADRPWYQRPHFRVAWERPAITDFSDGTWIYRYLGYFIKEIPSNVRPEEVKLSADYMDVVSEEILSPGIYPLISKLNVDLPVSAYRIRWRHSFRKVKPSSFAPKPMQDEQFEKFGFFRTALIQYNIDRGLTDWSYQYYTNRHNIATQEELNRYKTDNTPAEQRKPERITFYLSPGFPKDFEGMAYQIINEWNIAFKRALGRSSAKDVAVELLPNDYNLPKGQIRNIGDIRYKFLYWVKEPIEFGLLGYGPSFADPDTGEIVSCAAYVYGAAVRRVANRFLLFYDIVNGVYTDEDLRNGKDYIDAINNLNPDGTTKKRLVTQGENPILAPEYQGFDVKKAHEFVKSPLFRQRTETLRKVDRAQIQGRLSLIDSNPELKWSMMTDELLQALFPRTDLVQLRAVPTPDAKEILDSYLNPANLARLSGIRQLREQEELYHKHNMYMEAYVDPALSKFVLATKNLSRDQLYIKMQQMIFRGTEAHELGHTLGLRHNFEASADEKNYFKEYYELKAKQGGNTPTETDGDNRHRWFYMYSSIMDYHGETYGDAVGIGKYDHAAIMYGYGDKLEITDADVQETNARLDDYLSKIDAKARELTADGKMFGGIYKEIKVKRSALQASKDPAASLSLYTGEKDENGQAAPELKLFAASQVLMDIIGVLPDGKEVSIMKLTADDLSGREAIGRIHSYFGVVPASTRTYSDGTPFVENDTYPVRRRSYRFCSDELVGQSPYCNRFDAGSNPVEIVDNMIRRYDGTYPMSNWNRGRRFFRLSSGYIYGRMEQFRVISDFYQNWIFRVINETDYEGSQEYFNQLSAIQRGVAFLSRVVHTPEPGRHSYDVGTASYRPSADPTQTDILDIPLGVGRYFYSRLQQDDLGLAMARFERIGTTYDKYVALLALSIRDWGLARARLDFFYVNFSDYFSKDDVHDLFAGAIGGIFQKKYSMTFKDRMIEPNWHPVLQFFSMYMAMALLNNSFYGNSYSHYMTVGVQGNGSSWTPPAGAKTISFTNSAGTRTYFAVQTEDQKSISWRLIERGKALSDQLRELRAAQPTSAVNAARIAQLETDLRWIETVVTQMKKFVSVFYED